MSTENDEMEDVCEQRASNLLYGIKDNPPWYITLILGLQAFMTCLGSIMAYPFLISGAICLHNDSLGLAQIMGTNFFVSGITTILQTSLGVRLPIVQSMSFAFVAPIIALFSAEEWNCVYTSNSINQTLLPEVGGDIHREMWTSRIRELNGTLMVAALLQILVGFSGILGFMLRFIGPLTIAPTITLISLSLFDAAYTKSEGQWWITIMTLVLIIIFSQYLKNIRIPCVTCSRKTCRKVYLPLFNLFPIITALILAWIICFILTSAGVFPDQPDEWGYAARTDTKLDVIKHADWFRLPYPGQWGLPTVSAPGILGLMAGIFVSMVESIGDYHACARMCEVPPPPASAVNRGIGMEGIGCLLAGALGCPGGMTSYGENIGAIGITKVGSRRVILVGGVVLIVLGCLTKFSAVLVTLPDPVIGGLFLVMFGMVSAVGVSNLQFVDLNSSRNLFIFGISLFCGICIPKWLSLPQNIDSINTGSEIADQILTVLLTTSMFLAGLIAFILDNTISGSEEERGMKKWRGVQTVMEDALADNAIYDIPFIQPFLDKQTWTCYMPFLPNFKRWKNNYAEQQTSDIQ